MRRRWKRKSSYVTPQPTISKKELIENDLFLDTYYNDWQDYRDGMRDWYSDFKLIKKIHPRRGFMFDYERVEKRIKMNQKQKKLLRRRKRRKYVHLLQLNYIK